MTNPANPTTNVPPPPPVDYERTRGQMVDRDEEHLRILSICWYVLSGLAALMGCVPIIHVTLGLVLLLNPGMFHGPGGPPPTFMGWLFLLMGSALMVFGWTMAALSFLTARSLRQRRWRVLCLVTAGLSCLQIPVGATLGVFTFIVLSRPSIKASFQ